MTDVPPRTIEFDDFEGQYGPRFTIEELRQFVAETAPKCPTCSGQHLHFEAAVDDPSLAFMGGLTSPRNTEVFLCYILACEDCGTVRVISREITAKWRGKRG